MQGRPRAASESRDKGDAERGLLREPRWDTWAACSQLEVQVRTELSAASHTSTMVYAPKYLRSLNLEMAKGAMLFSGLILFSHVFIRFAKSLSSMCWFLALLKITVQQEWVSSREEN